jgi:tRNA pseudouridine38-40 synthase
MSRIKLLIEYDGTDYVGWQRQKSGRSIQQEIEECLNKMFKQNIRIYVSGRTDSGVHALGQVAHFDLKEQKIKTEKIFLALNDFLKKSENRITILESTDVKDSFHSRFSVKKKTYLYKILNRKTSSHLLANRTWFIPIKLDVKRMVISSKILIGKYDFNSFRSADCQAKKTIRSIENILIKKNNNNIDIRVSGKSFMHNQVRIIVGTLVNVGKGKWNENKIIEILRSKDRRNAGPTAPPCGLYLEKIFY